MDIDNINSKQLIERGFEQRKNPNNTDSYVYYKNGIRWIIESNNKFKIAFGGLNTELHSISQVEKLYLALNGAKLITNKAIINNSNTKNTMTTEEFDKIIQNRLDKIKELILSKGEEYVRNNDRFHNFNRAGAMRGQHPLQALQGMLDKHLISWLDIVDDVSKGKNVSKEYLSEKIGDNMTYFALAEALVSDIMIKKGAWLEKESKVEKFSASKIHDKKAILSALERLNEEEMDSVVDIIIKANSKKKP
jgi:hypothetical protein